MKRNTSGFKIVQKGRFKFKYKRKLSVGTVWHKLNKRIQKGLKYTYPYYGVFHNGGRNYGHRILQDERVTKNAIYDKDTKVENGCY